MDSTTDEVARLAKDSSFADAFELLADGIPIDHEWEDASESPDEDVAYTDAMDFLSESVLEAYAVTEQYLSGDKYTTAVVLVLGTGGPHHEYRITPSGDVYSYATWGSDSADEWLGVYSSLRDHVYEMFDPEWLA